MLWRDRRGVLFSLPTDAVAIVIAQLCDFYLRRASPAVVLAVVSVSVPLVTMDVK